MSYIVRAYALRRAAMLSLNAEGWGLALTQLNVPDFDEFSWETLPIERNEWGCAWQRVGWEESWEGKLCGWDIK